ncbi:MAG TPA: DUF6756 family protein [Candidatus Angelobacter sp.]|nr:DUF6756 family protein [Candidatus Angelobacter sp.]
MHEIESWIVEVAEAQNIKIRKLSIGEAQHVLRETMTRYVKNDAHSLALWMDLSKPVDEYYDRNLVKFADIVPSKTGPCWLVPETDAPNAIDLPVYEIDVSEIGRLINDCFRFEYYVVAHDFSWFVAETHHDQYYVCRETDSLPNFVD